jgi:uncharacterized protein
LYSLVLCSDEAIISIITRLIKQRKESIQNFLAGGRDDLVDNEQAECAVIQTYLPDQLSEDEIMLTIDSAIERLEAKTIKDMGKVMNDIKSFLAGKADMSLVGSIIRKKLDGK